MQELIKLNWKTTSYELKGGFIVDVTEHIEDGEKAYDAFIYHKEYGIKHHLVGATEKALEDGWGNTSGENGFMKLVVNTLYDGDAIEEYKKEVME